MHNKREDRKRRRMEKKGEVSYRVERERKSKKPRPPVYM
jgi:hypothetical protein